MRCLRETLIVIAAKHRSASFSFGDAVFFGSTDAQPLHKPMVSVAPHISDYATIHAGRSPS